MSGGNVYCYDIATSALLKTLSGTTRGAVVAANHPSSAIRRRSSAAATVTRAAASDTPRARR
jgi:hypothetical protein